MKPAIITRKEIAAAIGISTDTLSRRATEWRLETCRSQAKKIPRVYFRTRVNALLIGAGVIDEPL